MYTFYENIKKEVDLQDLVQYLHEPLKRLKVVQLKLEKYKSQKEHIIEIEQLLKESNKLTEELFPKIMSNYNNLSLEFRNEIKIKKIQDNNGKIIYLSAKDLLLSNVSKLIEHIYIIEEQYNQYFSVNFLINNNIASTLGFKENDNPENYNPIILENKYVFSKEDSNKMMKKKLNIIFPKIELYQTHDQNNMMESALQPTTTLSIETQEEINKTVFNESEKILVVIFLVFIVLTTMTVSYFK